MKKNAPHYRMLLDRVGVTKMTVSRFCVIRTSFEALRVKIARELDSLNYIS